MIFCGERILVEHCGDAVWEEGCELELSRRGVGNRGQGGEVVSMNEIMSGVQQNLKQVDVYSLLQGWTMLTVQNVNIHCLRKPHSLSYY